MLALPRWPSVWFRLNASWVLPLLTLALVYAIAGHVPSTVRPWLAALALFDLTVSAALIAWSSAPRSERHPEQLVLAALRGFVVAWLLLPLVRDWWAVPALLGAALVALIAYGLTRPLPPEYAALDDLERRVVSFSRVTTRSGVARLVAAESATWPYLWSRPRQPRGAVFPSTTGAQAEFILLIFLIMAESLPVHFLLESRFPVVAGVHLLLNVAGVAWCAAQLRALRLRQVTVGKERLFLRHGLLWTGSVALQEIAVTRAAVDTEDTVTFRLHGNLRPNVTLKFTQPITLYGPGGVKHQIQAVSLFVDDPRAFLTAMDRAGMGSGGAEPS
ncbi:hypothetical protein [Deinococcus radiopugnans]|uniref:hypothetical protein n=1 Tax=Deinococcus radiopugnans TaxID=57497 RepID=UPI0012E0203B|nr:hypothetical protein [Deinococcus radiopugnans]